MFTLYLQSLCQAHSRYSINACSINGLMVHTGQPRSTDSRRELGVGGTAGSGQAGGPPDSLSRSRVAAPGHSLQLLHPEQGVLGCLCGEQVRPPFWLLSLGLPPQPQACCCPGGGGAVPPFKLPWFRASPFHVTARGPARAAPQLSSTLLPIVSL